MKTILLFIVISALICNLGNAQNRTEKRNTNPFTDVSLRVSANLYIEQGDEHSIEITASERTLDKIIVEVNEGKLIIRFSFEDRWINDFNPGPIDIRVVTKNIYLLSLQGSGNIYVEKPIETHTLELNVSGSGDIKLSGVKCDKIDATITGSGDIVFDGHSAGKQIEILIAGSGDVKASEFEAEAAYIKIAGSGDSEVSASHFLDVSIYGSGNVRYNGDPSIKQQISGSGRVSKK